MNVERSKSIPLGSGLVTTVDARDYTWLKEFEWTSVMRKGKWFAARQITEEGAFTYTMTTYIFMHEEIAKYRLGLKEIPEGTVIFHENENTLDNRLMVDGRVQLRAIAKTLKNAIESGFAREINNG